MIAAVRASTAPEFEELLALAHRLFPPETREPDETLRAEADGRSPVPYRYLAWVEKGVVAGFVRFAALELGAAFVVHLGVTPERQGSGIGSRLLRAAREMAGRPVMLAEVEEGHASRWWRRQGAQTVSETYTQPALRPETGAVPLSLVAIGPWREVPRLVERFYAEVWSLGEDDPLVRQAVDA